MVDLELLRVKSALKRDELFAVLDNINPGHYERLNLVRFLGYVGYSIQDICDIIHELNCWGNYSQNMTYNQVRSVFKWLNKPHITTKRPSSNFNPCERSERGAWIKHNDYMKLYKKALCTIHPDIHCPDCPDNIGHNCKWVRA